MAGDLRSFVGMTSEKEQKVQFTVVQQVWLILRTTIMAYWASGNSAQIIHMYTGIYVCIYVCTCMCIYMYVCMCILKQFVLGK